MLGTSGKYGVRLLSATVSGRIVPARICGATAGRTLWNTGVCPESTDCTAGAAPWNGTCVMSIPFSRLNSQTQARCGVGTGVAVLAGIGLEQRDQLFEVLRRD